MQRYKSWLESWLVHAPPGAELPRELLRSVGEWWNALPTGEHLLVSHAGVNRALRVLVGGHQLDQLGSLLICVLSTHPHMVPIAAELRHVGSVQRLHHIAPTRGSS